MRSQEVYFSNITRPPLRLTHYEHGKRKKESFTVNKPLSKSRSPPFSAHFFWEKRAGSIRPWKSRPSLAPRLDGVSPYQCVFAKNSPVGRRSAGPVWAIVCSIGGPAGDHVPRDFIRKREFVRRQ